MPLDTNYTVKPKALKKFHPIPTDKYQTQITDINLLNELNPFSGKEEDRLNFEFTVLDDKSFDYNDDADEQQIESTRGRKLWKRVAPSLSPATKRSKASWLYKLLCAVEKKELDESELSEFSPATLIGQQVVVMAEQTEKGYNNILSFAPIEKEMEPVPPKEELTEEETTAILNEEGNEEVDGVKKK